jgi:hypothetical protein
VNFANSSSAATRSALVEGFITRVVALKFRATNDDNGNIEKVSALVYENLPSEIAQLVTTIVGKQNILNLSKTI